MKTKIISVVVAALLLMVAVVAFPGLFPPLRDLIMDRIEWAKGEFGSPEEAWEYAKGKIPAPSLRTEIKPSGSSVRVVVESDRDCTVFVELDGPLGEQKLAEGVVRRFRTTLQELPDGEYEAYFLARRCVGLSGKPAEYKPEACQETMRTERFVIDTAPPVPTGDFWVWHQEGIIVITGSAEDLSGLAKACVGRICVAAEDGAFELQVPLRQVNKHLRKHAAVLVTLTDAAGNRSRPVAVVPPTPTEGWIVVDGEGRLRSVGLDGGGLGGNPPAWTVEFLKDGQILEAFGTTPLWYFGVRVAPFMIIVLLILSWRARATLLSSAANFLDWLAGRLEGQSVTTEES